MRDYSELRAKARAATPGEWSLLKQKLRPSYPTMIHEIQDRDGNAVVKWGGFDGAVQSKAQVSANAAHIAAANPATILALLEELEALRAASKPAKRNDYPPAFDEVWAAYPVERQGTKRTAFKAWAANVKRGVEPAEMALGLRRYLAHAEAIGTETKYLKLAATFFGPDEHFAATYVMPQARQQQLGKAGQATARAAQDWMGES